jgi:hypothetical protein
VKTSSSLHNVDVTVVMMKVKEYVRESARISNPNPPAQIPTPIKSLTPSAGCAARGIVFTKIAGRETRVIHVAWPSLLVSRERT